MAEDVTIDGQRFRRRHPLGVAGLTLITLGIYGLYWYYVVNDELRRFQHDDSISPTRSLMAVLFGWIIIVPPFIALWNTAKHVQAAQQRVGVSSQIEPVLVIVLQVLLAIATGAYVQDHLNRIWDASSSEGQSPIPPPPLTA